MATAAKRLLAALPLLGACVSVPGTEWGEPCNEKGVCIPGLICEENICKDPGEVLWVRMERPDDPGLKGVWGTDVNNVFAVGDGGTVFRYRGGPAWEDSKQQLTTSSLRAVWGTGPNSVWAAGSAMLYFDGATWTKQQVFDDESKEVTSPSVSAVHGAGGQVYALAYLSGSGEVLLRYTHAARRWDQVAELNFDANDLWVTEGGQVLVVGNALHVKRFDGQTLHEDVLPSTKPVNLRAIWSPDGASFYAVGAKGTLATSHDGKTWTVNEEARNSFEAHDLVGLSASDLFVVGEPGGYSSSYSGVERCSVYCTTNPLPEDAKSKKLWGAWITPDGAAIYVVGDSGIILRRQL